MIHVWRPGRSWNYGKVNTYRPRVSMIQHRKFLLVLHRNSYLDLLKIKIKEYAFSFTQIESHYSHCADARLPSADRGPVPPAEGRASQSHVCRGRGKLYSCTQVTGVRAAGGAPGAVALFAARGRAQGQGHRRQGAWSKCGTTLQSLATPQAS